MVLVLFAGKPKVLLQVEFETTFGLIVSMFVYASLASEFKMESDGPECLRASSQAFGSNSSSLTFKPCVESRMESPE